MHSSEAGALQCRHSGTHRQVPVLNKNVVEHAHTSASSYCCVVRIQMNRSRIPIQKNCLKPSTDIQWAVGRREAVGATGGCSCAAVASRAAAQPLRRAFLSGGMRLSDKRYLHRAVDLFSCIQTPNPLWVSDKGCGFRTSATPASATPAAGSSCVASPPFAPVGSLRNLNPRSKTMTTAARLCFRQGCQTLLRQAPRAAAPVPRRALALRVFSSATQPAQPEYLVLSYDYTRE